MGRGWRRNCEGGSGGEEAPCGRDGLLPLGVCFLHGWTASFASCLTEAASCTVDTME